jgi:urease accessory protein
LANNHPEKEEEMDSTTDTTTIIGTRATPPSLHFLLLLSDSALPLGSFAFSSGLESYLAHHKPPFPLSTPHPTSFDLFLHLSIRNLASTHLPYVLAAYKSPHSLSHLDNHVDASTACTVARRASIAQGKALLTLWERAFVASAARTSETVAAIEALDSFAAAVKKVKRVVIVAADQDAGVSSLNAHFAPLFGVLCCALGLAEMEAAYLFCCNHAKSVLSAAVRAGVMGPYASHGVLASQGLQTVIRACVDREKDKAVEMAGLSVPVMDLWVGRHELLYSRIFNS